MKWREGVSLAGIYTFGANSRKLTNEDEVVQTLKPIADYLKAYPDTKITISGNTDLKSPTTSTVSSDDQNITIQQLMDGRAQTLTKVLVEKLKVNPVQVSQNPGTQGSDTNGNIKVIQPKKVVKKKSG